MKLKTFQERSPVDTFEAFRVKVFLNTALEFKNVVSENSTLETIFPTQLTFTKNLISPERLSGRKLVGSSRAAQHPNAERNGSVYEARKVWPSQPAAFINFGNQT